MTPTAVCATTLCFSGPCFTGKERDTKSGNDYFGARYYASSMGRFMSPDWSAKLKPGSVFQTRQPADTQLLMLRCGEQLLSRVDLDGHADLAAECKGQATCHKTVTDTVNIVHYDSKTKSTVVDSTLKVTTKFDLTTNAKGKVNVSASSTVENVSGHELSLAKTPSGDIYGPDSQHGGQI